MLVPPPPVLPPPPPPHASTPPATVIRSISIPSIVCHLRRRAGMPKSMMKVNAVPPAAYQGTPGRFGWTKAALVGAVVEIVSVAVPAVVPEMRTGAVEPKLTVGGYWAPVGLEVTEAVKATVPVKPPDGVTVTVDVFDVVAPGVTLTAVPPMVKLGFTAVVTVTEPVPEAAL